jgi:SNF2 family DNA or RNA helicase
VLPELPPKTEDLYVTELVGEQKDLYRQVASRHASSLIQQLHDEHSPIPYMHIFALLSALKQVCNHPASYLRDTENYSMYQSGKWDTFVELLEEAQESGQKVVVFSQFLAMLDIIGNYLRAQNIPFAEIRGSTKERGAQIAYFQQDPACQVFLGSLQASGLGIDLTAGSVVIHYDRWWNAARENQATDRVHRIGQSRGVMVYKLMTADTIEERIDRMIARKSQLLEDVVSYDDHQMLKRLDRGELLELLEGLDSM